MNDEPSQSRWRFSLRDLFVVVGCVCLLLAAAVPFIRLSIEAARKHQCEQNLKEFGLAVHNFHDTFNGLPPLGIGERRPSFFLTMTPFYSNSGPFYYNLFNRGNQAQNTDFSEPLDGPTGNWSRLSPAEQGAVASQRLYHCPARGRPNSSKVAPSDAVYFGPTSDYAVVFFPGRHRGVPNEFRALRTWEEHYDVCDPLHVNRQWGAIRLAAVDCAGPTPNYLAWKPRDTMARITDGTSTTLILGEKYVRPREIHLYADDAEKQDGTYLFEADQRRSASVARNMWFPLASDEHDPRFRFGKKASPQRDFGFGGPHAEGILFAVADGSVKCLNRATSRVICYRLAHCQDGLTLDDPRETEKDFADDDPNVRPVPGK